MLTSSYNHFARMAALVAISCALFCTQQNALAQTDKSQTFQVGGIDVAIPQPASELIEMGRSGR